LLAIASYVGKTRFIDNIVLNPGGSSNVFDNV
jgi:pantothenate synthetase